MDKTVSIQTNLDKPTKVINQDAISKAVAIGKAAIDSNQTKVDAVRKMYPHILEEEPEVIWRTFVDGAGLTEKGAVTYWYNVRRDHKKGKLKGYFDEQP